MNELNGRVALVTGGGRGIGAAVARELARRGAAVGLLARTEGEVTRLAETIARDGGQAVGVAADVANYASLARAVDRVIGALGKIDILVNNAAIIGPLGPLAGSAPEEWARTIEINLIGSGYAAQLAIPHMEQAGWGRIINVSSGAGLGTGIPRAIPYSVSKAGLDMLTRTLSAELEGSGVAVIGVRPGVVDTEMQSEIRAAPPALLGEETSRRFHGYHEQGELLNAAVPARLIAGLCTEAGVTFNGQTVRVSDEVVQPLLRAPNE